MNTVFVRGIWYCLHERGSFSTLDVAIAGDFWVYRRVCTNSALKLICCPTIKRRTQVYLCVHGNVFHEVLLEEPLKVAKNFRDGDWQIDLEYQMRSCPHRAFQKLQNEMEVFDTFNGHA